MGQILQAEWHLSALGRAFDLFLRVYPALMVSTCSCLLRMIVTCTGLPRWLRMAFEPVAAAGHRLRIDLGDDVARLQAGPRCRALVIHAFHQQAGAAAHPEIVR